MDSIVFVVLYVFSPKGLVFLLLTDFCYFCSFFHEFHVAISGRYVGPACFTFERGRCIDMPFDSPDSAESSHDDWAMLSLVYFADYIIPG